MILLDTHTLLWMDRDDGALGPTSRVLIEQAWRSELVAVSAISFWEAAMLIQRKRIELPIAVEAWRADMMQAGLRELPVDGRLAVLSTSLDGLPRDPADRFIVATAIQHSATLITADLKILAWPSDLVCQNART